MYSLLKPFIFKIDPEMAHDLAIKSLKYNFLPEELFKVEKLTVLGEINDAFKEKIKAMNPIIKSYVGGINQTYEEYQKFGN